MAFYQSPAPQTVVAEQTDNTALFSVLSLRRALRLRSKKHLEEERSEGSRRKRQKHWESS